MSAERIMWAHGENGLELCPESEVIEIKPIPLGRGNIVVPETVAWLSSIRDGGGVPTKLREIAQPSPESDHKAVRVTFDCTPIERYRLDSGPVYGEWSSCYVRNAVDVRHPIFNRLTTDERQRMLQAVQECDAMFGVRH